MFLLWTVLCSPHQIEDSAPIGIFFRPPVAILRAVRPYRKDMMVLTRPDHPTC